MELPMAETLKRLLTAKQVRQRCGNISDMSLWRWLESETLGFPKPVYIMRRRFWDADEVEEFIARQAAASKDAA
jgi:predicted DNA-binding transcriptional regulator AlpA